MKTLRRESKALLVLKGDNKFSIEDRDGNVYKDADSDYIIYMKNVIFRRDGKIQGTYLGEIDSNDIILKANNQKVSVVDNNFKTDDEIVKSARMITVDNKKDVMIVIPN